jgi:hypothetical protein
MQSGLTRPALFVYYTCTNKDFPNFKSLTINRDIHIVKNNCIHYLTMSETGLPLHPLERGRAVGKSREEEFFR